jgi:hypothetical protein
MNVDPELKAKLLAEEENCFGPQCVEVAFSLDSSFRHYLTERFEKEPIPDEFKAIANSLGFDGWDALGFQRAPGTLPKLAFIQGFEETMSEWNAEWEATGERRLKREQERQQRAKQADAYNKLCKLVPKALRKARKSANLWFYGPFEKAFNELAGYRYYIGTLLAKEDEMPLTDLPLEVGIGLSAAARFQQEHKRWPEFPFDIDRLNVRLIELH